MLRYAIAGALALSLLAGAAAGAKPVSSWRAPDPDNTLVIDTNRGRIIVELRPEIAPASVERLKLLAREKVYDGLLFHRVIDRFMAQTGDPGNVDGGKSSHPDLKAELGFRRNAATPFTPVAAPSGWPVGLLGTTPVATQPDAYMARSQSHSVGAWGLYCPGVMGMGRGDAIDSANSEFFLMREAYPSLDKRYTVVGRVLVGLDVVRGLKTGEPVKDPDRMIRVRVLGDIPVKERPRVEVMDTTSAAFAAIVRKVRAKRGADFSVCDLEVPARVR